MSWPRPVPVIGDATSAEQRAADPSGWAMPTGTQEALSDVIAARRDIRNYRADDVSSEVLKHVLAAGHSAPSVGHSQPWRFITVRSQATRDRAALLADAERLRQANQLTPERRAKLLDLKLEGIRDAPVGIVVACDRRAAAPGVLGRATFIDTDMWSCACAIQNMWLTARASGLGMGWVTFFQPDDLAALLNLPSGVETLGWMCLGWPDERPPEPGLQRRGWSKRMSVDDVILHERWPDEDEPEQPASHLNDQAEAADRHAQTVMHSPSEGGPTQRSVVLGRDSGANRLTVPGSLGVMDQTVNRVLAWTDTPIMGGTLALIGADHPVTSHGISAFETSVTHDVLAAARQGESMGASVAMAAGLKTHVSLAAATSPGDLVHSNAMSADDVDDLLGRGEELGVVLGQDGLVCLGEVGVGNTTVAGAMTAALLHLEPSRTVGLGADADTGMVERKIDVVTRALDRAIPEWESPEHGSEIDRVKTALTAVGGPEIAVLAGIVIGAATHRVPVVLDGYVTSVAALIAVRLHPHLQASLVAGQSSREQGHQLVLTELGLEPLLDLRLRAGEGVGACLAAQMLLTSLQARDITATTR